MEEMEKKPRKGKHDVFKVDTEGMSFADVVRKVASAAPTTADGNPKERRKGKAV